ncbi:MAG: hypothetical protein HYY02_04650 [Chloroflexi bacterium]|nr:hypothetical protein [Chloroflexota bacterium]
MCTGIVETAELSGSGKGAQGWFPVTQANVGFDHPSHVALDYAVLIDFVNPAQGPGARVAVELTAESARGLARAILTALEAGEAQNVLAPSSR